ncbi:MAG: DMT family transporter [Geminicoccaceae bacterium]|nr:DMT family transporter [Geminicoccaceae bacterium]MCB9942847.1 DMT family transporter [Geminicoccaceae bacterium]
MLLMTFMDVLSKQLVPVYGPYQVAFLRYAMSLPVAAAFMLHATGGKLRRPRMLLLQVVRCVIITIELTLAIMAFGMMPLANAHAVFAATPLVITALAVPILGEKVGWRRWLAVAMGFIGVMIILRPGDASFQAGYVIVLVATLMFAVFQIMTRILTRHESVGMIFFIQIALGTLLLAVPALLDWKTPTGADWLKLAGTAILGSLSHLLLIKAYSLAAASILQPFSYSQLLWAIVLGIVFFGDIPDMATLTGASIVVGAGIFAWWRSRVTA